MEALQYIYTSWRNGDSAEKGYMIYSRSSGVTEEECAAIKDAMQYLPPKELNLTPSEEEIADTFPYSFAYFVLPTGRRCVAQSTYLGKDYSGRFGNYIIYAMIFKPDGMRCYPAELFGEDYIKTFMTQEELAAPSPVPPLPVLHIESYGSIVNDDQISEFLFDKEEEFAMLIEMVLKSRSRKVPFYINDSRENLVLWAAALQRMLPRRLAEKFCFSTYVGNHEFLQSARAREEGLDFAFTGVRPDANYFNYGAECRSNRCIVIDFLGGHMTQNIQPGLYASAMAASMSMDYEDTDSFNAFLDTTSLAVIDGQLEDAFQYYRLLKYNEFSENNDDIRAVLGFGRKYCLDTDNTEIAGALLLNIQEKEVTVSLELLRELWDFVCRYAEYMTAALFDAVTENCYQAACDVNISNDQLLKFMKNLKTDSPEHYRQYLETISRKENVDRLAVYLAGHPKLQVNQFYTRWILSEFRFSEGLSDGYPVTGLFSQLLHNLCRIHGSERLMIRILIKTSGQKSLFSDILKIFTDTMEDPQRFELMCEEYLRLQESVPEEILDRFEKLLFSIPCGTAFASRLLARRISASRKPLEEFWRFYEQQKSLLQNTAGKRTVSPMVAACLNTLSGEEKEYAAIDMMLHLPLKLCVEPETGNMLCDILDGISIKNILKQDPLLMKRACQVCEEQGMEKTKKLHAVLLGQKLKEAVDQGRVSSVELDEQEVKNISLCAFSKADYENYEKNFLPGYISFIYTEKEWERFIHIFSHAECFKDTVKDYIGILKRLEKKDYDRWRNLMTLTTAWMTEPGRYISAREEMKKPFIRYMKSVDEDSRDDIRKSVESGRTEETETGFWEEIERKEGFQEKLGGLFRKGGK